MSTFAGEYVKEPSDLRVVCNEAEIIAACDDPGAESARDVLTFAELSAEQKAAIVAVMDSLIEPVESEIHSRARVRGYAIPLSPVDALITKLAVRMLWIDMRQRNGRLTSEAAEKERETIRDGDLASIASGKILLTAAHTGVVAPAAHIYKISSAHQRDTTGKTERISRASLGRF
jgi:hypothetical protein